MCWALSGTNYYLAVDVLVFSRRGRQPADYLPVRWLSVFRKCVDIREAYAQG